jgi:hypothetical protein
VSRVDIGVEFVEQIMVRVGRIAINMVVSIDNG